MKKLSVIFVLSCLLFLVFTCTDLTNPFVDKQGSMAKIVKKGLLVTDTVDIFSTESVLVELYLKEHLDSFKIHIDNNRLWNSSDIAIPKSKFVSKYSFAFPVSFFDIGWQSIKLISYVNNGTTVTDSCSVYAKSPLRQSAVSGAIGDSILLSTDSVNDDVLYIWDLHNGVIIKEPTPVVKTRITTSFASLVGELYVEDLNGHRSPSVLFPINSTEQSDLKITCKNDSVFMDSIYSTTAALKFSLEVSGAQHLKSARVNKKSFDDSLRMGELFILNYNVNDLDTIKEPVKLDITITDNLGRNFSKSYYIHYVKIKPVINVLYPVDSMQTIDTSVSVLGNIVNFQQYSNLFLLVKNNGVSQTKINITKDKPVFSFDVSVPNSSNHISLILYPDSLEIGSKVTETDFYVFYNPEFKDTTPPQIRRILCNNETVESNYISRTDSVLLQMDIVDNSKLTVTVNGKPPEKGSDELYYSTKVFVEHKKDSTAFVINAMDSSGYSVTDTVFIKYNRLPQWIKTPSFSVITAGESSKFEVTASDSDNDTLFITMTVKHNSGDIILNASNGYALWTPQLSDVGEYNVILRASDGYESIVKNFEILVKEPGSDPVRFNRDSINFPDTLFVGQSLNVNLKSEGGIRPFSYRADFVDNDGNSIQTILDGNDSVLRWTSTVTDVGIKKLRVQIKDSSDTKDVISKEIVIMKEIVAFLRWDTQTKKINENSTLVSSVNLIMKPAISSKIDIPFNITFPATSDAANSSDFGMLLDGIFRFKENDTIATVHLFVYNDTIPEFTEKFEIKITESDTIKFQNGVDKSFHGEIIDDDMVEFSFNETEASRREADIIYTAIVELSEPLGMKLELSYQLDQSSTAELGKDFTFEDTDNKIVFNPGETTAEIKIKIIEDIFKEENEKIVLKLECDAPFTAPKDDANFFVFTIIEDSDKAPIYSFVTENDSSGSESISEVKVKVNIKDFWPIDTTIVLQLSVTSDEKLKFGADYTVSHLDTLIFTNKILEREITINIIDDTIADDGGDINIKLSSNSDFIKAGVKTNFRYIINSNESKVTINSNSTNVNEWTWDELPITFQLDKPADSELRVYFKADENSSADSGNDYRVVEPGYVVFKRGESSKDMHYYIIDDQKRESSEIVTFRITGVSNKKIAYIGESSWIEVKIDDNDSQWIPQW